MSEQQFTVSILTTKTGWQHIIDLIQADTNSPWLEYNRAFISLIQNQIAQQTTQHTNTTASQTALSPVKRSSTPEDEGYFLGPDGKYHDPDWFGEEFGSYANYRRLEDEASDYGFPDAESYQHWLDE